MQIHETRRGQRVVIDTKDPEWAYVDGWHGYIDGVVQGRMQVSAKNPDGHPVVLWVPPEMLRAVSA